MAVSNSTNSEFNNMKIGVMKHNIITDKLLAYSGWRLYLKNILKGYIYFFYVIDWGNKNLQGYKCSRAHSRLFDRYEGKVGCERRIAIVNGCFLFERSSYGTLRVK